MKTKLLLILLLASKFMFSQTKLDVPYDSLRQIRSGKYWKSYFGSGNVNFFTNQNAFVFNKQIKVGEDTLATVEQLRDSLESITIPYPSAGIPISTGTAWGTSITDNHTNWDAAYEGLFNKVPYSGAFKGIDLNYKFIRKSKLADPTDTTKQIGWNLSNIPTNTEYTITFPSRSLTLNDVRTTTTTNLTGILKGDGSNIGTAVAGTDYQAPLTDPVTGTGASTANQIPVYSNTGNKVAGSSNLTFPNNILTVAGVTNEATAKLGRWNITSDPSVVMITDNVYFNGTNYKTIVTQNNGSVGIISIGGQLQLSTFSSASAGANTTRNTYFQMFNTGKIGIGGGYTAAQFGLDINASTRIAGTNSLYLGGTVSSATDYTHSITNGTFKPRVDADEAYSFQNAAGTVKPLIINSTTPAIISPHGYKGSQTAANEWLTSTEVDQKILTATVGDVTQIDTSYNAATNLFPSVGSGVAGAVKKADWYRVGYNKGGTLGTTAVVWKSTLTALVDNPGQTATNWDINTAPVVPLGVTAGVNKAGFIPYNARTAKIGQWSGTSTILASDSTAGFSGDIVADKITANGGLKVGSTSTTGINIANDGATVIYNQNFQIYNQGNIGNKYLTFNTGPADDNPYIYGINGGVIPYWQIIKSPSTGATHRFYATATGDIASYHASNGTRMAYIDIYGYLHNTPPHFNGWFTDSTIVISLTQNTWYQLTNQTYKTTWSMTDPVGFSDSNDTVVVSSGVSGHFIFTWQVDLSSSDVKTYQYRVQRRRGATITTQWQYQVTGTGTDVLRLIQTYVDVQAGDRVWVEFRSTSVSPGSLTLKGGQWFASLVHM